VWNRRILDLPEVAENAEGVSEKHGYANCTSDSQEDLVMQRSNVWSASTMLGDRVRNAAGENLGKIEDLVLDPSTGQVRYAVLSFGGFLGVGDKLFAIPWQSLALDGSGNHYILNVDKDRLRNAPGFDRNDWPDMTDSGWQRRTNDYYGHSYGPTMRAREVVVEREVRRPRQTSLVGAALLLALLVGLLWFTYKVSTTGWDTAKNEALSSFNSAAYAMKETSSDATLTAKIQTAYSLNKRIPSDAKINVDSQEGLVTLRGEVTSDEVRNLAEMIARDTPGVSDVRNHLYVMGGR
jgi:sporulation protein YlmC with PRC-barrel domain